jgi:hypothetical protein
MHEQRMRRVAEVFQIELPIAFVAVLNTPPAASSSPSGARSTMSSNDVVM